MAWSGDHCSLDPDLVKGIFLCNRPIKTAEPNIRDMFPTLLELFSVPVPASVDGRSLLGP